MVSRSLNLAYPGNQEKSSFLVDVKFGNESCLWQAVQNFYQEY